jgi:2-desacetyl-2-hydroxyethyl bacteriochlorophyllide A dehydrogenase
MPNTLLLTGPRQLAFHEENRRPLARGEARLRSIMSGISHGTELAHYTGKAPFGARAFDLDHRLFRPRGTSETGFPQQLGYEMVSEVVEVSPDVVALQVGDVVHTESPHQDESIINVAEALSAGYPLTVLPSHAEAERGLFVSLGMVALQAVHDANLKVGDTVAVSGLGVIGQLAVQLVRLNGADPIFAIDPIAERRALAQTSGATAVIDPHSVDESVAMTIRDLNRGRGVDAVIETSGSHAALADALASADRCGRVISVGFYNGGSEVLRLGEEWHHNRLTLISSMGVWDCPHRDAPLWDRRRVADTVVDLLYSGRLETSSLLTELVPFSKAPAVYARLAEAPNSSLKTAFTYDERPSGENDLVRAKHVRDHRSPALVSAGQTTENAA